MTSVSSSALAGAQRRGRVAALCVAGLVSLGAAGCSSPGSDDDRSAWGSTATASSEQSRVDALIASGLQQLDEQDLEAATTTFGEVLELQPDNAYASYNLGYIAQVEGDVASAVTRYTQTLAADKEFAPALYNLAILTEASDLRAAVALYRRDIAVKPDDAAAYVRLGFALRHLGDEAEAAQMLAKGVELDPSLAGATPPTYP